MPTQLDWHIGDDDGEEQWETVEPQPPPPPPLLRRILRWVPRWVWYALLAAAMTVALSSYLVVRRRYIAAQEHLKFQIQSTIDLEAQAFEQRDRELFAAQLDARAGQWEREQRTRLYDTCTSALPANTPLLDSCYPILPAQIENVELREDVALVEVIEGDPPVRRVRFYRKTEQGWLHTSPKADFWQPAVETRYESLTVHTHRRDAPYTQALLDHIADTMAQACKMAGCPPDANLTVEFVARKTVSESLPRFEGEKLLVDSPWLLGIPTEQTTGAIYRVLLERATVQAVVYDTMGVGDEPSPTGLKRAIADEFVLWYRTRDTVSAPLLGRIVDRFGVGVLPDVMRSLKDDPSLDVFLSTWLDGTPDGSDPKKTAAFFQTVFDIEREAMLVGNQETFRLFQFKPGPEYLGSQRGIVIPQDSVYLDMQRMDGRGTLPAVRVVSVAIEQDAARVQIDVTPALPSFLPPVEFFYLQDGVWKHSMPYYALDYGHFLAEQRDDQDRDVVTIRFGCDSWQQPSFERWAKQFNEQHPDIYVQVVPIDALFAWAVADAGYERGYRVMSHVDVALQYLSTAEMVDAGWAADLEPWIAQDSDLDVDDFYPGLLEQEQQAERAWSLPIYADAEVLFYDKDAFDAAGVPYPRPGWTQDEFLATAQALTVRRGNEVSRYGFADGSTFAFVKSRAGDALSGSAASPGVDLRSAEVVDAVRWYTDLALVHGVMPHPQALGFERTGIEYIQAIRQLVEDKRAAMWSASIVSWAFRDQQFNLGVAPYPVAAQAVNQLYATQYVVMNAHTTHPQACWLWMAFLTRQYEPHLSQYTIVLPVRRSLAGRIDDSSQVVPELAATIRYVLQHPWVATDMDPVRPIYDAIQAVYRGASVEDALADAQASWGE